MAKKPLKGGNPAIEKIIISNENDQLKLIFEKLDKEVKNKEEIACL